MKKLAISLLLLLSPVTLPQSRPYINVIINQIGKNINTYFLAANRPAYGVSSYLTPKGYISTGFGVYTNKDVYDVPFDISFGISDRLELSAGITAYSQTYNFLGEKIRGIGDANLGVKYLVHESDYFDHSLQFVLKIPTASKNKGLGTGKVDFNFGLAQGFYFKRFSYDLGLECNVLARRDFPAIGRDIPRELKAQLDSLKQHYTYKYETEIAVSLSPSFEFTDNIEVYSGYSFTRNMKLNYNTNSLLYGIGISAGEIFGLSLGGSYGLDDNSGWLVGLNMNFLFRAKK